MDRTLVNYVRALRAAGADASIAESIDAARAVALLGYADRRRLKDGLGVVLAKTPAEKLIHERVFDQFFGAADASAEARQPGEGAEGARGLQHRRQRLRPAVLPRLAQQGGDAGSRQGVAVVRGDGDHVRQPRRQRDAGQTPPMRRQPAVGVDSSQRPKTV